METRPLIVKARRDAINACYESFRPYTCAGCIDYRKCPMAEQDLEALQVLAKILEGKE